MCGVVTSKMLKIQEIKLPIIEFSKLAILFGPSNQFRKSFGTIRKLLGNRSQAQLKWAAVEKKIL
jgi:hypothetical protein